MVALSFDYPFQIGDKARAFWISPHPTGTKKLKTGAFLGYWILLKSQSHDKETLA